LARFFEPQCSFSITKHYGNSDGNPVTGASNAGEEVKIAILNDYLAIGSMTAAVRDQQLTVFHAVVYNIYGTDRHAPVNAPKTREQNIIYLYAAVNLKRKYY